MTPKYLYYAFNYRSCSFVSQVFLDTTEHLYISDWTKDLDFSTWAIQGKVTFQMPVVAWIVSFFSNWSIKAAL